MGDPREIDIRQVSKLSGLPSSTLRYYEEKGLIQSISRRGIARVFHASVLEQLSLISLARYAGFSLDEIACMFTYSDKPNIDRDQLLQKVEALDKNIQRLVAMRDGFKHLANCPEDNQLECSNFQNLVKGAMNLQHEDEQTVNPDCCVKKTRIK
ncbi:helix-turn-helix domain-containing protein [Microbulbifer sp. THAF38]|uniref:helix-turn-helix domain-containing protein n=1 Tax=Microbulbifer sp. THAF38 TaxID=2587856 RepID=UPI0012AA100C|nr:helix-turn-helix domain-containing protein [Microbulbifer sp. THAF38]QFT56222.1 HTH-type transcriptional regulator CueR [Microbulbifer sp. THAF38]